jgi:RNA polymerase sigma-70 factor (ECF subfamily)
MFFVCKMWARQHLCGEAMRTATPDALEQLTELLRTERAALVAVARAEGVCDEDALECVQEALCTFLSRSPSARQLGEPPVIATLKATVRNAARNLRRRHHRRLTHTELVDDSHADSGAADSNELLVQAEELVRLRSCVAELCSVQRAVVMLRLLDERSGEDVAAELGLTRSHVDVLVHRAKSALRVCMRHVD